ncbi:MAG: hypothetical protein A2Z91_01665 [Deltaproteobacteria bacterium GWA2_38_16]|nr:MAG: hypothetical protein A2Z91_01665 [Deltaproteobacteria bacterium GWA2_38_16]OGQ03285.1 MAG: hypothetical protein A3D19_00020 [Deltaproteobacteria bacterium RIFCSPHIGHO2_02_FULL_38_15]OGQ30546.1 MAG: hypothetical protein A3A72_02170 [Deltaproteobacteria bacterium RIFCSPLOWO2_01_FULL_38_9]OGQ62457.1 MAG: hypothetical protein A3G92_03605 [Deltaproteobacteria bacterium RIFCSPLOWO2_12_FULL_38_8]
MKEVFMKKFFLFLCLLMVEGCSPPLSSPPSSETPYVPANVPRAKLAEVKTTLNLPEIDMGFNYPMSKKEFFGENQTMFPKSNLQVFATILVENKSSIPLNMKVEFDGSLKDEIEESFQGWQEDQWVTTPISSTTWIHAPVIVEVKQWKEGNLLSPQQGKVVEVRPYSGLLVVLLTRYDFRDVMLGNKPQPGVSSNLRPNLRVDTFSLLGELRISSDAGDENWKEEFSSSQTPISLRVVSN